MRGKIGNNRVKSIGYWLLLLLFVGYVGNNSLFIHTHIINSIRFTHSHPYKMGREGQQPIHSHTSKELILLEAFFNTSIDDDIISDIDLRDPSGGMVVKPAELIVNLHVSEKIDNTLSRAPPFKAVA